MIDFSFFQARRVENKNCLRAAAAVNGARPQDDPVIAANPVRAAVRDYALR